MGYIYTMGYYLPFKKSEIVLLFAATWMKLEMIILSKSKRERQIPYDITYMWNLKYDTNEPVWNRNNLMYIYYLLYLGYYEICYKKHKIVYIFIQVLESVVFFGKIHKSGIMGWYGGSVSNFLRNLNTIFHSDCTDVDVYSYQ